MAAGESLVGDMRGERRPGPGRPRVGGPKRHTRQQEDEAKRADELAKKSGVPVWGAYRVIRGELTLNELVQDLIRRERFERLQKAGMDSDLAGHVASGNLAEWRATVLMNMRRAGRKRFSDDRIESAGKDQGRISVWRFGATEVEVGVVAAARTYDFDFLADGSEAPVMVFKHDIKVVSGPEAAAAVAEGRRFEKKVVQEGLGASRERKDRYRPAEEALAKAVAKGGGVRWVFRDGTALEGPVRAFGRWDMDVAVGEHMVTVFFHALHSGTDRYLKRVTG